MTAEEEALIESVTTAYRDRDVEGTIKPHHHWHDLDAAGRIEANERTRRQRLLEAALDREGLSTTARAVLARIREKRTG